MSALDVGLLVGIPVGVTAILFGIAKLNGSTLSDFKTWQLILASLHLCFAFTMLGLTASNEAWVVNVNVQYNVWDVNDAGSCSDASPCSIDLAVKNIGEFQTTYLVPFFSIVSGMHHLVAAASYYLTGTGGFYNSAVESGVNWVRQSQIRLRPQAYCNVGTMDRLWNQFQPDDCCARCTVCGASRLAVVTLCR